MKTRGSEERRTVLAWGRIPAGRPEATERSSRRGGGFGRYPRSEQLSIFQPPEERAPSLRELRLPGGGPPPFVGPWTLAAVVGEAVNGPSPA